MDPRTVARLAGIVTQGVAHRVTAVRRSRSTGRPVGTTQWLAALVSGNLLLVGGNGLVVWAEQTVPSGRAALVIATTPVWFAILEWLRPGGRRPNRDWQ